LNDFIIFKPKNSRGAPQAGGKCLEGNNAPASQNYRRAVLVYVKKKSILASAYYYIMYMSMKTAKLLILCCPLLFLFLFCRCAGDSLPAGDDYLPGVADAWVYPKDVKNTTEEARRAAYQLPADVLKSISTAGLIRSFLGYPALWATYCASSNSSPIGNSYLIYAQCNSIEELDRRPDRAEALWTYYKKIDIRRFEADDIPIEAPYQLITLQALFTREKILSEYDRKARREIVSLLLEHLRHAGRPLGTYEVIALIMYADRYEPAIKLLGQNIDPLWFTAVTEIREAIASMAKKYIQ
jgi:hypothetical protein